MRIWLMILSTALVSSACTPLPDDDSGAEDVEVGDAAWGDDADVDRGVTPTLDSSPPPSVDMAGPEPDMAPPETDMASPELDMAPPELDMAPPEADVAPPELDMASPEPDMASPEVDMASPEPDMAPPEPDMASPEPDMAPPECAVGAVDTRMCGLNDRGRETRTCEAGAWTPWQACVDPDECVDGPGQVEACGLNDRGERPRSCIEGRWQVGACLDPDACADGAERAEVCGLNDRGEHAVSCVEGRWQAGACVDPDVCTDGADRVEPCGPGGRGLRAVRCAMGRWQAEDCVDAGACAEGEERNDPCGLNGRGTQAVRCEQGGWQVDACVDPDACVDGADRAEACGLNGRGERPMVCEAGAWQVGECVDGDMCVDGVERVDPCGLNGRGTQPMSCADGVWQVGDCVDPDGCVDRTVRAEPCGLNGRGEQSVTCEGGRWQTGRCVDVDECVDGADRSEACGLNGRGELPMACEAGAWQSGECVDADVCVDAEVERAGCPWGPDRRRVCVDGAWGAWSECEAAPPPVLINEILPDAPGADAPAAFIELWAPPGTSLAGVSLIAINGNDGEAYAEVALQGVVPDDGFFVIADPDAGPALAVVADLLHPIGDLQNGPDALQLWHDDRRIDAVAYGDTDGGEGQPAPDPGTRALGRDADHTDTDDNAADFAVVDPSPGAIEPGDCVVGMVEVDPCGLNDRGARERTCGADGWGGWSACVDPDGCTDGDRRAVACGPNLRGLADERCVSGAWGPPSACEGGGVCVDDDARPIPCGPNGRGVADEVCVEGAWGPPSDCEGADVCAIGDTEGEVCGLNGRGERIRTCGQDGAWSDFGACIDPDVCLDGDEAEGQCDGGVNVRACVDGAWVDGPCRCAPGEVEDEACGFNGLGVRGRVCGADGWGPWDDCADPDVCVDGDADQVPCDGAMRARNCVDGQWVDGPCGCDSPDLLADAEAIDGGWRTAVLTSAAIEQGSCGGRGSEAMRRFEAPAADRWMFTARGPGLDPVLYARGDCADAESELACSDDALGLGVGSRIVLELDAGDAVHLVVDQFGEVTPNALIVEAVRCSAPGVECDIDEGPCVDGDFMHTICVDGTERDLFCETEEWVDWVCGCEMEVFFDVAEEGPDETWTAPAFWVAEIPGDDCSPEGYHITYAVSSAEPQTWVFEATPGITIQSRWFCGTPESEMDCAVRDPDEAAEVLMPLAAGEFGYLMISDPDGQIEIEITARPCDQLDIDHPCRSAPCGDGTELASRCGLNGRGLGQRRCEGIEWVQMTCDDPDVCIDGDIREGAEPCPEGGHDTTVCDQGMWSPLGCAPADCAPGVEVEGCGQLGRGTRHRTCRFDGQGWTFEPWGLCDDPDACEIGSPGCVEGYRENGHAAQGILRVALFGRDTLWHDVGLGRVLSLAIAEAQGDVPFSTWPGWTWPSLAALDAVDGVDRAALDLMFDDALARGWVGRCGDGWLQPGSEQCEDGNVADGDGCAADCTLETACGNGIVEGAEQCDAPGAECDDHCRYTALPARQRVDLGRHRQIARQVMMEPGNQISSNVSFPVDIVVPQRARIRVRTETGLRFGWHGSNACPRVTYTTNNDIGARNFQTEFRPTVRFSPIHGDGEIIEVRSPDPCNTDIAVELPPGRYRMTFLVELPAAAIREDGIIDFTAYIDEWTPLGGPTCGDGIIEGAEECDDGNQHAQNCQANCRWPRVHEWYSQRDPRPLPPSDTVFGIGTIDLDNTPRDQDYFQVELGAATDMFIGLTTPEGGCAFDASLILLHEGGGGSTGSAATGPDGCPEIIAADWPAGTSTIRIRGVPDNGNVAPYVLEVTRGPR